MKELLELLVRFSLFEEVNPKDISFVAQMDDYFTVAFEFENTIF